MAVNSSRDDTIMIVLAVSVLFLYFVPTLFAFLLRHRRRKTILLLNLLTGWTIIGWAIVGVWSTTAIPRPLASKTMKHETVDKAA